MARVRVRDVINRPLVVIVGPTASGKTALAIRIAKAYDGEVISADSRAIYKGLSIGTAKPSISERQGVVHWGIDLVEPGRRFTAADFKEYATHKINDIRLRGHVPILVGGTGLYVDSIIYNFGFMPQNIDLEERDRLSNMKIEDLHKYCIVHNILLPTNPTNKRHVVNNILRNGQLLRRESKPIDNTIVVGISTDNDILNRRIEERAESIFESGVIEEAVAVASQYGWDNEAMTGNVYPLVRHHIEGELSRSELIERFIIKDRQLAKRQRTWFRRSEHIYWADVDGAYRYIAHRLDEVNNS